MVRSSSLTSYFEFQSTPPRGWRPSIYSTFFPIGAFQSTPPRGWRLDSMRSAGYICPISIHSTARVETNGFLLSLVQFIISIHSTARVETALRSLLLIFRKISIHSTARVETKKIDKTDSICQFQSTPPRGWRHSFRYGLLKEYKISIHSTARVETRILTVNYARTFISIHSTARVETERRPLRGVSSSYFNPLHREGGDVRPP